MKYEELVKMCPSKSRAGVSFIEEKATVDDCIISMKQGNILCFYSRYCIPLSGIDIDKNIQKIRDELLIPTECSDMQVLFKSAYKYMQSVNRRTFIMKQKEKERREEEKMEKEMSILKEMEEFQELEKNLTEEERSIIDSDMEKLEEYAKNAIENGTFLDEDILEEDTLSKTDDNK